MQILVHNFFTRVAISEAASQDLKGRMKAFCSDCEIEEDIEISAGELPEDLPYASIVCIRSDAFEGFEGIVAEEIAYIFEGLCDDHEISHPPIRPVWVH